MRKRHSHSHIHIHTPPGPGCAALHISLSCWDLEQGGWRLSKLYTIPSVASWHCVMHQGRVPHRGPVLCLSVGHQQIHIRDRVFGNQIYGTTWICSGSFSGSQHGRRGTADTRRCPRLRGKAGSRRHHRQRHANRRMSGEIGTSLSQTPKHL